MLRTFVALTLIIPSLALSDTFVCVPEKGSGVTTGGNKPIASALYDASTVKWIMTNERGDWRVKQLGEDVDTFDKCTSQFFCERSTGYAGVFMRDPDDGTFQVTWITVDGERKTLLVAAGKCSKL
jgi:hypothetical protein